MKRTTSNPRPPIPVLGKINVPVCDVMTLEVKDRAEMTPGQPLIINKIRYIVTQRLPEGAKPEHVFVVLGRDKSTRAQRRQKQHADKARA